MLLLIRFLSIYFSSVSFKFCFQTELKMSLEMIIISFSLLITVIGVKLPGPCPKVPETHLTLHEGNKFHKLILSVPFTKGRRSALFLEIDVNDLLLVNFKAHLMLYKFTIEYRQESLQSIGNITFDKRNGQLRVKSRIYTSGFSYPEVVGCHKPKTDFVKMWSDDQFTVLYSCEDISEVEHDEAVLFAKNVESSDSDLLFDLQKDDFYKMMEELNSTARTYLSNTFLNTIDWKPIYRPPNYNYNPFECPAVEMDWKSALAIAFIFFLCLACIGFAIFQDFYMM